MTTAEERLDDIATMAHLIETETEPNRANGNYCWASQSDWFRWACDVAGLDLDVVQRIRLDDICEAAYPIDNGDRDAIEIATEIYRLIDTLYA